MTDLSNGKPTPRKRSKLILPQNTKSKSKEKRWSHQAELDYSKLKSIDLIHTDGSATSAMLVDSDQFTLKIVIVSSSYRPYSNLDKHQPIVALKHSLSSYQLTEGHENV